MGFGTLNFQIFVLVHQLLIFNYFGSFDDVTSKNNDVTLNNVV